MFIVSNLIDYSKYIVIRLPISILFVSHKEAGYLKQSDTQQRNKALIQSIIYRK